MKNNENTANELLERSKRKRHLRNYGVYPVEFNSLLNQIERARKMPERSRLIKLDLSLGISD